ncbi:MAG: (d)CMP kinase [Firmicutes bacterium]|nr:(d)CMP kinase [Bacillota bacterium]
MSKIVAIDGPAGSGKGTVAEILSEKCNLINIDTGATYRCVALAALNNNLTLDNVDEIVELSGKIKIEFTPDKRVLLDNKDVTDAIRSKEVTSIVSPISSILKVRENMVKLQREMAKNYDVVMEGRDITTVVLPNANYKFYLDATLEERANRRYKQYQEKGIDMTLEEIKENISKRDYNDMHKEVGSLIRTDEQVYIDSTNMTIEEVVNKMIEVIEE